MKIRTILDTMIVCGLLALIPLLILTTPTKGEPRKADRDAERIAVLLNDEGAYEAIVDNYKTGKTIGQVLDEIIALNAEKQEVKP